MSIASEGDVRLTANAARPETALHRDARPCAVELMPCRVETRMAEQKARRVRAPVTSTPGLYVNERRGASFARGAATWSRRRQGVLRVGR